MHMVRPNRKNSSRYSAPACLHTASSEAIVFKAEQCHSLVVGTRNMFLVRDDFFACHITSSRSEVPISTALVSAQDRRSHHPTHWCGPIYFRLGASQVAEALKASNLC